MEPQYNSFDSHQHENQSVDASQEQSSEDESISVPQDKKMYVMGEEANNQMLMVPLFSKFSIWTSGQVVFSNKPIANRNMKDYGLIFEQMKTFFKLNKIPPRKIENTGKDLMYCCLRRRNGGGKIIFLNESVYQEEFYINYHKLLTINYSTNKYELTRCNELSYLSKIKLIDDEPYSLFMTLQANPGNIIMEKSLQSGQKLYLQNAEVVAMSTKIKATREKGVLVLQGSGFVFMENRKMVVDKTIFNLFAFLLLLLLTLLTL